jgi:hypothetical protein
MPEIKRMTMLARKPGLATSDFRNYWAGPHARLALGMDGITKYVHNRIDKALWSSSERPQFDVDGIVELYFASGDAMKSAQASAIGQRYIPDDEPVFLKGWTLCMVEPSGETRSTAGATKVLVAFHAEQAARERLTSALASWADETGGEASMNWTVRSAKRPRLWAEPSPPDGFIAFRVASVAKAHEAFDGDTAFARHVRPLLTQATAYLIDELKIR